MSYKYAGPTLPTALAAQRSLPTATSPEQAVFANGWYAPLVLLHPPTMPQLTLSLLSASGEPR